MTSIEPITLVIDRRATPGKAWAFITEPGLVASWFAAASPIGEVGTQYRIDFGDGSVVDGGIIAVEPGRTFVHEWAWLGDDASRPTLVRWAVDPAAGGGSRVTLVHEGWTEAGADDAIRDDHEAYWSGYLDDLRDLLDEGPDESG